MLEAIAILPIIFSFIIPIFFFIVIYGGIIALIVWFIISFLKTQKERNQILKEISEKLTPKSQNKENVIKKDVEETETELHNVVTEEMPKEEQ